MRRRGRDYKFTNKRHSKEGLASSGISFVVLVMLGGLFYLSYRKSGAIGAYAGVVGIFAMLASAAGLVEGVRSFKKEDSFYLFSYLGTGLNGMLLVVWIIIYVMGS